MIWRYWLFFFVKTLWKNELKRFPLSSLDSAIVSLSFIIGGIDGFFLIDDRFFCRLLKRRVWNTSASKQHRSESIKELNCFSNRLIFIDLFMFGFGHWRFFVAIFFIRKEACFEIQGGSDDRCFVTMIPRVTAYDFSSISQIRQIIQSNFLLFHILLGG